MESMPEISSAILVAALVSKSDLTGRELERYAINMYRFVVQELKKPNEGKN